MQAGWFRQDLFFRLSVFPPKCRPYAIEQKTFISWPSSFLEQTARRMYSATPVTDDGACSGARELSLAGNIRELQNVIERAVILAKNGTLRFGLHQAAGLSVAGTEYQAPISTRRQLLAGC